MRAAPMNTILLLSSCTLSFTGSTANSGSVPTMMSRIRRRAGGTGVGVLWRAMSRTPKTSSRTMSLISLQ